MATVILRPTADVNPQWAAFLAGTNWEAVLSADSDFVFTIQGGKTDLYSFEPLDPAIVTVNSVTPHYTALGDDVSTMRTKIDISGSDAFGSPVTPNSSAGTEYSDTFLVQPNSDPWTPAAVNLISCGPQAIDDANPAFPLTVGEFWLVVDYEAAVPAPDVSIGEVLVIESGNPAPRVDSEAANQTIEGGPPAPWVIAPPSTVDIVGDVEIAPPVEPVEGS